MPGLVVHEVIKTQKSLTTTAHVEAEWQIYRSKRPGSQNSRNAFKIPLHNLTIPCFAGRVVCGASREDDAGRVAAAGTGGEPRGADWRPGPGQHRGAGRGVRRRPTRRQARRHVDRHSGGKGRVSTSR